MTPKDPFLEGTFWDKFWRPIRSRALLFTPEQCSGGPRSEIPPVLLGIPWLSPRSPERGLSLPKLQKKKTQKIRKSKKETHNLWKTICRCRDLPGT